MKIKLIKRTVLGILGLCLMHSNIYAGNPDRAGQAGATQLLINPWARSSGWGGVNMAGMTGVEAMSFNVAGLVGINRQMEFNFSRTNWISGSDININSFGMVQKLGSSNSNALGISIMSFDFGDISKTTVNQPEGAGSFTIQMMNIGLGYSHKFSDNINGGVLLRTVSEGVFNAKASGLAVDAGIQYKAGKNDRIKFGVALRNIGPTMRQTGDGLSSRSIVESGAYSQTLENRSSEYELPSVLNIAASYDIFFDSTFSDAITIAGSFTSNAFSKDQIGLGVQGSMFKRIIQLRAAYILEPGSAGSSALEGRTSVYSGPSAGLSVNVPFGKEKDKRVSLDYSYRFTSPLGGTHTYGLRLSL